MEMGELWFLGTTCLNTLLIFLPCLGRIPFVWKNCAEQHQIIAGSDRLCFFTTRTQRWKLLVSAQKSNVSTKDPLPIFFCENTCSGHELFQISKTVHLRCTMALVCPLSEAVEPMGTCNATPPTSAKAELRRSLKLRKTSGFTETFFAI